MDRVRRIGYLEEDRLWTAAQGLSRILSEKKAFHLELVPSAFFSSGKGQPEKLQQAAEVLMRRDDVDLILAAGSRAVTALLRSNNGRTPVLAFVIEDGATPEVLRAALRAGAHNLAVRSDVGFARQGLTFFHRYTQFQRLGIFVRPGELSRSCSTADTLVKMGATLGFEVVAHEVPLTETFEECRAGIAYLLEQGVDAFYVGDQQCFDPEKKQIAALLHPLHQAAVPTFAREGAAVVRQGAFMGNSSTDFLRRNTLTICQMEQIFSGLSPDRLSTEAAIISRYALNLDTLERLGIDPPFDLLAACDEFFEAPKPHDTVDLSSPDRLP